MGKALKTAGAIIGGAVLIATGVGAIAGLQVTAIGIAGVGSLSVGALNTISAGLMAVGGMLDKPKSTGSGSADEWTSNPNQPTPFAFGRVGVAGKIVHRDEYGPDNRLQGIVSIYSGAGPIKGFVSYKADEAEVGFEYDGGTAVGKYRRQMWRSWRTGTQPDTALTLPSGLDGGAVMPGWTSAHKLSGKACDLLTVQQDSKFSVYPSGVPTPKVELDGIYGYDPRFDSTYSGGLGDCRLNDRSTWRWIDCPIIAGLNWALGMKENGKVVGGIGATIDGIDVPAFVESANIAEANGWKVTAWPDTSEDASVVLDQFLQAGGARRARHAGKISCVSRGAARPSVVTITRRDTAGPIELDTGASAFNKLNTITPEFMSAAHAWKIVPASPVSFPDLVSEDGGQHSDQIRYRFVPAVKQAAELAAYDILDAREPFSGTIPLKPHMRRLKRGDCFDIDEPGFLLDGVKCIVLSRGYDPKTGLVTIAFRSETDGKHDLALGKTTTMPSYPSLTAPDPTYVTPPLPTDWEIVPRAPADGGVQLPIWDLVGEVSNSTANAVVVEWGAEPSEPPPDPLPEGMVFADYIAWNEAYYGSPTATRIPISGMQPGETYYVAVRHVRGSNFSARSLYGPEVVPALVALTSEESEALDRLDRIDSDGWLTKGEKPFVLAQFETASGEYAGIATQLNNAGLPARLTAYNVATSDLMAFVGGLDPALDDFTEDTAVSGGALRAVFRAYFLAKQAGLDALTADNRERASLAAASASAALADLSAIASDNILHRSEKSRVIEQVAVIQAEFPKLRDQAAAFGAVAQHDAYVAAKGALDSYLASLTPAWNSLVVDTPIIGSTFRAAFQLYYQRRQEMLTAQMGITDADAGEALARLAIIDADGWLSKGEKSQVIREYEAIVARFGPLRDQAGVVGATSQRTALIAAKDALDAYLASLTPAWTDTATDTVIVPATFRARFAAYYAADQAAQTAIETAVGADGSAALTRLAIIESDGWLSVGEKPEVIRLVGVINAEYPGQSGSGLALGLTTQVTALANAIVALNDYLAGLSPAWDNPAVDTPVVGSTFRAYFNAVYLARAALQNAMVDALDDAIEVAIERLNDIASDDILSRNEKPEIMRQVAVIVAEKPGVVTRLTDLGLSTTAYVAAYDALVTTYLPSLSPAWNDLSQNTPVVGATFRQKFVDYYVAKAVADEASIGVIGADVAEALAALSVIASDDWLSAGEKPQVLREVASITGEYSSLDARAAALGVTTARTTWQSAYDALVTTYLPGLIPAWNSLTTDTPIVGSTFRARFAAYYIARQALMDAITAALEGGLGGLEDDLAIITSDNWLSRSEKPTLIREVGTFNNDYPGLGARAGNLGVTTELTAHATAIIDLNNYVNSLSPSWSSLVVDTPISGSTLLARLDAAYATKQVLLNAFTAALDANADAALSDLAIIASDNWLSRSEKATLIREHATFNNDYAGLLARANNLGITTEMTAHATAIIDLNNYLPSLSPAWNSLAVDTPISGATLRACLEGAYGTKQTLQNAFIAALAPSAQWTCGLPKFAVKGAVGGSGTITTDAISFTNANAPGAVTYSWTLLQGSDEIGINSTSSANPRWNATPPSGQANTYQAVWGWTATSGGQTRDGLVFVTVYRDQ